MSCRNCATPLPEPTPAFCGRCGQEARLHPPTLHEFAHEFVSHYVALEGALWRSLGWLLVAPGRLTREYLAGRRRRYVLPLRLYLTLSLVFFLALRMGGSAPDAQPVVVDADAAEASQASQEATRRLQEACGDGRLCERLASRIGELAVDRNGARQVFSTRLTSAVRNQAPYVALALVPVLAGWLALLYRSRARPYGAHMVAALHLQAAWFLWLLPGLAWSAAMGWIAPLVLPVITVLALQGAYGGRWVGAIGRAVALVALYGLCVLAVSVLALLAALLLG